MSGGGGTFDVKLHVLVAAVTCAERGQPLPLLADMARAIGCPRHNVSMALTDLERRGVVLRLSARGRRARLRILATGKETAHHA